MKIPFTCFHIVIDSPQSEVAVRRLEGEICSLR